MKLKIDSAIWKSTCWFMIAGSIVAMSPRTASLYTFLPPATPAAAAGAGADAPLLTAATGDGLAAGEGLPAGLAAGEAPAAGEPAGEDAATAVGGTCVATAAGLAASVGFAAGAGAL